MTLSASYFEEMYSAAPDPWSLAARWYEQRKYDVTLASLTRPRYRRAFEPGCSVGVLTQRLAARCDELLATDVTPAAVDAASQRLAGDPSVQIRTLAVPQEWPDGSFDLIVISEIGYYLSVADLRRLVDRCVESLDRDGELVVVHWRHEVADYPRAGDEVQQAFRSDERLAVLAEHREEDFGLDLLTHPPAESVASREGLV